MNNLVELIRVDVESNINSLGYELYNIEYVNELGHNYLRIIIRNLDPKVKITTKDCEIVSKTISPLIDDNSIKDKFFLEVCSPGINRKLFTEQHMNEVLGGRVLVKLTKSVNGSKKYLGTLLEVSHDTIFLKFKEDIIEIKIRDIKNINLEEISQEDI